MIDARRKEHERDISSDAHSPSPSSSPSVSHGEKTRIRTRARTRHNAARRTKRNSNRGITLEEPFNRLSRYSEDRRKGFPAYRSCPLCALRPVSKRRRGNERSRVRESERKDIRENGDRHRCQDFVLVSFLKYCVFPAVILPSVLSMGRAYTRDCIRGLRPGWKRASERLRGLLLLTSERGETGGTSL